MLIDLLDEASGAPDALALVGEERSWTYAELEPAVTARADALRAKGARPGEIFPVAMDASAEAVIQLLSLWRAGVTPAPLNTRLTPLERQRAERALVGVRSEAQAVLWTSGTAGRPRGVAISYRNLVASALASQERLGLGEEDVWLASLSPAHVGGLALITRALLLGSRLVAVGTFDAARTLELMERSGSDDRAASPVTHVSVVPTQLHRMLELKGDDPPPRSFRLALVGGARTPAGLLERAMAAGWPVALTYGLTEATSQVATAPPESTRKKPGTLGKPLSGVEVRIDDGGEVLVRGPTVASGYVGAEPSELVSPDGWLHTGDMGRLDADGDLWITGRRSDRIVSGGVTIDAAEVEEALRAHPSVRDACVVGLADEEWGERVAAMVEPPEGGRVDEGELSEFLRERLSGPKRPRVYRVASSLPRNANGKVDRHAVRVSMSESRGDV